ncbi:MAG: hypothetical protein P8Y36_13330, partial [Alphaproteobacteria bacterium]
LKAANVISHENDYHFFRAKESSAGDLAALRQCGYLLRNEGTQPRVMQGLLQSFTSTRAASRI